MHKNQWAEKEENMHVYIEKELQVRCRTTIIQCLVWISEKKLQYLPVNSIANT